MPHIRIKYARNERASILFLRRKGYTITALKQLTGRSSSIIYRILKFNRLIGNLGFEDLRKIPNQLRRRTAQKFRMTIEQIRVLWEPFILGETDKPP